MKSLRPLLAVGILTAATVALTACGGGSTGADGDSAPGNTADVNYHVASGEPIADLVAQLPESIAESGKLVIATDATIGEPFGSYDADGATMVGIAPDLAFAFGDALGLDIELRQVVFANLIPGLAADRYDFSLAPMLDTEERQQQVDFIDFLRGGSQFIVARDDADAPENLSPDTACGLAIGVAAGSVEEISLTEKNETCAEPINIMAFKTNNEGVLALTSGRIDAYGTAAAQAGYIAQTDDEQLTLSGEPFQGGLSGMAFPKDSELLPVIQAVFQTFIDEGTYDEMLSVYGLQQLAVPMAGKNNEAAG
ncbi:transporter substrate-binding domain-containing protein [Microbacterium sp. NPDC055910]|uniref:transporter substrate-binding domain-containing protein n=1 Tax=Microbacterium sp. NPDC055910 TaxID=3345659 RepID=UPI0035DB6BEF